jgi:hypothetical protein
VDHPVLSILIVYWHVDIANRPSVSLAFALKRNANVALDGTFEFDLGEV